MNTCFLVTDEAKGEFKALCGGTAIVRDHTIEIEEIEASIYFKRLTTIIFIFLF